MTVKTIAALTACLFLCNSIITVDDAEALAAWSVFQQVDGRRKLEIETLSRGTRIIFAEPGSGDEKYLDNNCANALLVAGAKILVRSRLKDDPLSLLRVIQHEKTEALMQSLARQDPGRYRGIGDLIRPRDDIRAAYLGLARASSPLDLPDELLLNDIVATAFELVILRDSRLMAASEMTPSEKEFLALIDPVIRARRDRFSEVFWDTPARETMIRVALAGRLPVRQVASRKLDDGADDQRGQMSQLSLVTADRMAPGRDDRSVIASASGLAEQKQARRRGLIGLAERYVSTFKGDERVVAAGLLGWFSAIETIVGIGKYFGGFAMVGVALAGHPYIGAAAAVALSFAGGFSRFVAIRIYRYRYPQVALPESLPYLTFIPFHVGFLYSVAAVAFSKYGYADLKRLEQIEAAVRARLQKPRFAEAMGEEYLRLLEDRSFDIAEDILKYEKWHFGKSHLPHRRRFDIRAGRLGGGRAERLKEDVAMRKRVLFFDTEKRIGRTREKLRQGDPVRLTMKELFRMYHYDIAGLLEDLSGQGEIVRKKSYIRHLFPGPEEITAGETPRATIGDDRPSSADSGMWAAYAGLYDSLAAAVTGWWQGLRRLGIVAPGFGQQDPPHPDSRGAGEPPQYPEAIGGTEGVTLEVFNLEPRFYNRRQIDEIEGVVGRIAHRHGLPPERSGDLMRFAADLASRILSQGRGGYVTVRLVAAGGREFLELTGRDNGPGIVDPSAVNRSAASLIPGMRDGLADICCDADGVVVESCGKCWRQRWHEFVEAGPSDVTDGARITVAVAREDRYGNPLPALLPLSAETVGNSAGGKLSRADTYDEAIRRAAEAESSRASMRLLEGIPRGSPAEIDALIFVFNNAPRWYVRLAAAARLLERESLPASLLGRMKREIELMRPRSYRASLLTGMIDAYVDGGFAASTAARRTVRERERALSRRLEAIAAAVGDEPSRQYPHDVWSRYRYLAAALADPEVEASRDAFYAMGVRKGEHRPTTLAPREEYGFRSFTAVEAEDHDGILGVMASRGIRNAVVVNFDEHSDEVSSGGNVPEGHWVTVGVGEGLIRSYVNVTSPKDLRSQGQSYRELIGSVPGPLVVTVCYDYFTCARRCGENECVCCREAVADIMAFIRTCGRPVELVFLANSSRWVDRKKIGSRPQGFLLPDYIEWLTGRILDGLAELDRGEASTGYPTGSPAECLLTIVGGGLAGRTDLSIRRDLMPARYTKDGVTRHGASTVYREVAVLRALGILVDGTAPRTYQLSPGLALLPPSELAGVVRKICDIEIDGVRYLRRGAIPRERREATLRRLSEAVERLTASSGADPRSRLVDLIDDSTLAPGRLIDGSVYMPSPDSVLDAVFDEIGRAAGGVAGKHLLDLGAGDLRAGLWAANLRGMRVTACEKDAAVSAAARDMYDKARAAGLVDEERFRFLPETDAFSVSWRDIDVVYLFYPYPAASADDGIFRRELISKAGEMRPDALIAILFVSDQIDRRNGAAHRIDGLAPLWQEPLQVSAAKGGLFLQLYRPEGIVVTRDDQPRGAYDFALNATLRGVHAGFMKCIYTDSDTVLLDWVLVERPQYHRSGVGRALLTRLVEEARAGGRTRIALNCLKTNRKALAFFARMAAELGLAMSSEQDPDGRWVHITYAFGPALSREPFERHKAIPSFAIRKGYQAGLPGTPDNKPVEDGIERFRVFAESLGLADATSVEVEPRTLAEARAFLDSPFYQGRCTYHLRRLGDEVINLAAGDADAARIIGDPQSEIYDIIRALNPDQISIHLGWSAEDVLLGVVDHHDVAGDGARALSREELLERIVRNINTLQKNLDDMGFGKRVLLETLDYHPGAMYEGRWHESAYEHVTEAAFVKEVLRRTGARLLIDCSHVLTSAKNEVGSDPDTYMDRIRELVTPETVRLIDEIHLAVPERRTPSQYEDQHLPFASAGKAAGEVREVLRYILELRRREGVTHPVLINLETGPEHAAEDMASVAKELQKVQQTPLPISDAKPAAGSGVPNAPDDGKAAWISLNGSPDKPLLLERGEAKLRARLRKDGLLGESLGLKIGDENEDIRHAVAHWLRKQGPGKVRRVILSGQFLFAFRGRFVMQAAEGIFDALGTRDTEIIIPYDLSHEEDTIDAGYAGLLYEIGFGRSLPGKSMVYLDDRQLVDWNKGIIPAEDYVTVRLYTTTQRMVRHLRSAPLVTWNLRGLTLRRGRAAVYPEPGRPTLDQIVFDSIATHGQWTADDLAKYTNITVTLPSDAQDFYIEENKYRMLTYALWHLIQNAIKYGEAAQPDPSISILIRHDRDRNRLYAVIRDPGIGIPEKELDDVYDIKKVFRASNTKGIHGLGIGFNVSNAFIRKLGGKITFETKEGERTGVIVVVPAIANAGVPAPAPAEPVPAPASETAPSSHIYVKMHLDKKTVFTKVERSNPIELKDLILLLDRKYGGIAAEIEREQLLVFLEGAVCDPDTVIRPGDGITVLPNDGTLSAPSAYVTMMKAAQVPRLDAAKPAAPRPDAPEIATAAGAPLSKLNSDRAVEVLREIGERSGVVIWDWDHTLFHSETDYFGDSYKNLLAEIVQRSRGGEAESYYDEVTDYYRKTQGLTNLERFRALLEREGLDPAEAESYDARRTDEVMGVINAALPLWRAAAEQHFVPGALAVVRELKARGVKQYVVTGNPWLTEGIVKELGLEGYFERVYGAGSWDRAGEFSKTVAFRLIADTHPQDNLTVIGDGVGELKIGRALARGLAAQKVRTVALSRPSAEQQLSSSDADLRATDPDAIIHNGTFPDAGALADTLKLEAASVPEASRGLVRPATADDAGVIRELARLVPGQAKGSRKDYRGLITQMHGGRSNDIVLVHADASGKVSGYIYGRFFADAESSYIEDLAVAEEWQGQRIGSALFEAFIAEVEVRGAKRVTMSAGSDGAGKIALAHHLACKTHFKNAPLQGYYEGYVSPAASIEDGYAEQLVAARQAAFASGVSGESLIVYADDLMRTAAMADLEETVRKISGEGKLLTGGKVIIFARDRANGVALAGALNNAAPGIETHLITELELRERKVDSSKGDAREAKALIEYARTKGAKHVLALIKGPQGEPEELAEVSKEAKVPIILVGVERAFYSFAQAVAAAIRIKRTEGRDGWLLVLPPLRAITAELESEYRKYQQSLVALVAA